MTITEETRHRLYLRLEEVLGSDEAATLMGHLPPVGWADVATRRDLDHLAELLQADLEHHTASTKHDIERVETSLRGELKQVETSLRSDFERAHIALRSDLEQADTALRGDFGSLRSELERLEATTTAGFEKCATKSDLVALGNEIRVELFREQRTLLLAILASNSALVGLAFAAARLI